MKNDSSYQNYPKKHLILGKHNKKIHKVLREKSSSLYLLPVNCETNSTNRNFSSKDILLFAIKTLWPIETGSNTSHVSVGQLLIIVQSMHERVKNREENNTLLFITYGITVLYLKDVRAVVTMFRAYCIPD